MSILVTYFSAQGTTAKVANDLAERLGADIYEITPEKPYTAADIRYVNPFARCNREKFSGLKAAVSGNVENFADYDTVCIGFPIWYGCAPKIVDAFCDGYDWSGKKVFLFATSGGGAFGKTSEKLAPHLKGAEIISGVRVKSGEEAFTEFNK